MVEVALIVQEPKVVIIATALVLISYIAGRALAPSVCYLF